MAVWQCRLLLVVVLGHLALSSPVVRRDVLALDYEHHDDPLAQLRPETLGEDAFGPALDERGGREKRLLKTIGVGALGVKAAKAVGAKVVSAGAKAVGAKLLKTGGVLKAATTGAIAVKAKALGVKTVTAVAALGIKALLIKLLFGLSKTSLQPRSRPRPSPGTPAPDTGDEDIPTFNPDKITLQVPDQVIAPAFDSVNSISNVLANLIQTTAERFARLVERMKPILRSSLGFRSRKRQTENEIQQEKDSLSEGETTYFTDTDTGQAESQETAESQGQQQQLTETTADDMEGHSSIKTSFTALVNR